MLHPAPPPVADACDHGVCRCAKLIIQSRMQEVVYLSDAHRASDSMKASKRMLKLAGVASWAHKPSSSRIMIDFGSNLAIDHKIDGLAPGSGQKKAAPSS